VEGHTNVPRSPHAVFPEQRNHPVRRPFDLFLNARAAGCPLSRPAPTQHPCRGEARLALALHATQSRGKESRGLGTNPLFVHLENARANFTKRTQFRPPAPRTSRSQPAPLSNTCEARERNLRNEPNFEPNPDKMKPLALLRNEPNSSPPVPRTSARKRFTKRTQFRTQPEQNETTCLSRNEPIPRLPTPASSPRTKLVAIAMPASRPL
jgi:hypothetical protein